MLSPFVAFNMLRRSVALRSSRCQCGGFSGRLGSVCGVGNKIARGRPFAVPSSDSIMVERHARFGQPSSNGALRWPYNSVDEGLPRDAPCFTLRSGFWPLMATSTGWPLACLPVPRRADLGMTRYPGARRTEFRPLGNQEPPRAAV